jgi:large subunit ribosomal protein L24
MKRLLKGYKVRVISGKDKTKEGNILSINYKTNTAIVEGLNIVKRHTKPTQQNQNKGGIVSKEAPISLSKLAYVDAKAKRGISKLSYKIIKGKKVRVTRKEGNEVSK